MQLISQSKAKQIRALHQKNYRDASRLFLVEGSKAILETIYSGGEIDFLVVSDSFYERYKNSLETYEEKLYVCNSVQLSQLSTFKTNNAALAVVKSQNSNATPDQNQDLWLVLDTISDPGNLGTIIRLADWFGLKEVVTIGECVEWNNPKVISASMGSFLRIKQVKMDFETVFQLRSRSFLAHMDGESLHNFTFPEKSMLVIGNEANGISENWFKTNAKALTIPSFGKAESLNAGVAAGIFLNHYQFGKSKST